MESLTSNLAKTIELLFGIALSGAEGIYNKVKPKTRIYVKSLAITTVLWLTLIPMLATLKIITGFPVFAYAAAFLAVVLTLILGFLWTPIGILLGMLLEQTVNPVKGGERYVKLAATVLFGELIMSIYLIKVPLHTNLGTVPLLLVSALTVGVGSFIWGGWISGRFYTFLATVILALTTLSFYFPKTFEFASETFQNLDDKMSGALGYQDSDPNILRSDYFNGVVDLREAIKIPLTANSWSEETYVPAGEYVNHTPGEWLEYKNTKGQNLTVRVGENLRNTVYYASGATQKITIPLPILSSGEHMRFRSDKSGTTTLVPIKRK